MTEMIGKFSKEIVELEFDAVPIAEIRNISSKEAFFESTFLVDGKLKMSLSTGRKFVFWGIPRQDAKLLRDAIMDVGSGMI